MSCHMYKSSERKYFVVSIALLVLLLICITPALAAESTHHADSSAQLKDFLFRVLNFSLLAGILIWAMKKANIKGMLAARQESVAKSLEEANRIRKEAEQKLAEYAEKLAKATREIDEIQLAIKNEAEAEKQRIITEAKEVAERIREQAKHTAHQEVQKARAMLQAETARLSIQLAEATLRKSVNQSDQDGFVDEYLTKVVEVH